MRQLREELSAVRASKDEVELQMNNLRSQYDEKVAEVDRVSQSSRSQHIYLLAYSGTWRVDGGGSLFSF